MPFGIVPAVLRGREGTMPFGIVPVPWRNLAARLRLRSGNQRGGTMAEAIVPAVRTGLAPVYESVFDFTGSGRLRRRDA